MKRVIIYCEGPTEETFINRLLAPAFFSSDIYLTAASCDGVSKYSIIKKEVTNLCKGDQTAIVTTMLDYYQLPSESPGLNAVEGLNIYQAVSRVEAAISEDIAMNNFIPNLMLHEFEALLFSKPECFYSCGLSSKEIKELCKIRDGFETPEHINNGPDTAPSKRILAIYPSYQKPLDGFFVAEDIGIDIMRKECRHFNGWIEKLIQLND